jgi:hypothetical protein
MKKSNLRSKVLRSLSNQSQVINTPAPFNAGDGGSLYIFPVRVCGFLGHHTSILRESKSHPGQERLLCWLRRDGELCKCALGKSPKEPAPSTCSLRPLRASVVSCTLPLSLEILKQGCAVPVECPAYQVFELSSSLSKVNLK